MASTTTQKLAYEPGPAHFVPANLLTLVDVPNPGPPLQIEPNRRQRITGLTALALSGAFTLVTALFLVLAFIETAGIAWAMIPTGLWVIIMGAVAHRQLIGNYAHNRAIMRQRADSYELYNHYAKPGNLPNYTTPVQYVPNTKFTAADTVIGHVTQAYAVTQHDSTTVIEETRRPPRHIDNPPPEPEYRKHWETVAAEQRNKNKRQRITVGNTDVVYKPSTKTTAQLEQEFDHNLAIYVQDRIDDLDYLALNISPNDIETHRVYLDLRTSLKECHDVYKKARTTGDKRSADRMFASIKKVGAAIQANVKR